MHNTHSPAVAEAALGKHLMSSVLIMQGNLLIGVVDDTSDGYLALPLQRNLERYVPASQAESAAICRRFPRNARFNRCLDHLENLLELAGYDCVRPTKEALLAQLSSNPGTPAIIKTWRSDGAMHQQMVWRRPRSFAAIMSARATILKNQEDAKLFLLSPEHLAWWPVSTIKHLHHHAPGLVTSLPISTAAYIQFVESLLKSPLCFMAWAKELRRDEGIEWVKGDTTQNPISHWLFMLLGKTIQVEGSIAVSPSPNLRFDLPTWAWRLLKMIELDFEKQSYGVENLLSSEFFNGST